jgi:hypothetical protein
MIDNFSLGVTHVLLMLVAVRLLWRRDLDTDTPAGEKARRWGRKAGDDA